MKPSAGRVSRACPSQDDLSYLREFEHITLARVLLAQLPATTGLTVSSMRLLALLERLLQRRKQGERTGSVIEILMLQALAHQAQATSPLRLMPLQRALTLAEPEGYVRIFVDEGKPMARLLAEAAAQGSCRTTPGRCWRHSVLRRRQPAFTGRSAPQPLDEPLSQRELDVLRLIAAGLSNKEIGERLFVGPGHGQGPQPADLRQTRRPTADEALSRARDLGLL